MQGEIKDRTAYRSHSYILCVQFQDEPLGKKNPLTTSKKVWKHEITHANLMVKGNYNFMVIYWQSSWKMVYHCACQCSDALTIFCPFFS